MAPELCLPASVKWRSLLLLWIQQYAIHALAGDMRFFNKYGDCQMTSTPQKLTSAPVTLIGVSLNVIPYVSQRCHMGFKSKYDLPICMTFERYFITDCRASLVFYESDTLTDRPWHTFSCHDSAPSTLCTSSSQVGIEVVKDRNYNTYNDGYNFTIKVYQSNTWTEVSSVVYASIGALIGVIIGVVVVIAVLAFTVIYCCIKRHPRREEAPKVEEEHRLDTTVEPSAPPLGYMDDAPRHMYPQEAPPPYMPPPPYDVTDHHAVAMETHPGHTSEVKHGL